ncbi:MAG: MMPL family transporter, partial [Rhizobiaceae bacterium]|nr:MMPL family transporter [Rhizobiaceae bacterium]
MLSGFGLQKIGLTAVRFPLLASLLVVLVTALAGIGISRLGISGDNIEILRDGSKEMVAYDRLLSSFRNFNNDSVVLLRSDNLATVDGLENFRDLHFEFSLDERVESVLSLFSLVEFDNDGGGWKSAVPASFESDAQVADFLNEFARSTPSARSLMGADMKSAVIVVYAENDALDDARIGETMAAFSQLAQDFASPGTSISIAGQPAIRADLVRSIVGDLLHLVPIALLVCGAISLILFRHPIPVILCALPSLFTVAWFLGGAGLTGTDLNFLTNVLPVLLIVIIFADTLHLFLKFQRLRLAEQDPDRALHDAIEQIGPACAISSLTTAAALLSFCFTGNFGLFELGVMGALAVLVGFLSVIVVLPLGCHWAIRAGVLPEPTASKNLAYFAKPAIAALRYRGAVLIIGLVLTAVGLVGHWTIESSFRMLDYLASSSQVAESEGYIDERFAGTTPMFVTVNLPDKSALLSEANTKLFDDVLSAVGQVFPSGSYYSLDDLASEIEKGGGEVNESD